ncbi:MAG: SLC13 family permease [Acidilobaceae archaeon]
MNYSVVAGWLIIAMIIVSLVVRSRRPRTPVWSIMAFASFTAVVSGLVPLDELGTAINLDVILFLIGMFSIVSLAESSGLLSAIAAWFISLFRSPVLLVYASSLFFGVLAAVAMNDTVALVGPPIAYTVARALGVNPTAMFLLLAFSLTIGSVMTPIGNPQNVLIATGSGLQAPFLKFVLYLSIPTLLNLLITPYILMKVYGVKLRRTGGLLVVPQEQIRNKRDAALALVGLVASIALLVANDVLELLGLPHVTHRGFLPFLVASALYVLASEPRRVIGGVDWGTVVFFIAMFISMEGVWRSGALNPLLSLLLPSRSDSVVTDLLLITALSVIGSQLVSNVPFAQLMLKYMHDLGYTEGDAHAWIALAMATTIAGNLTLFGAASNIIILEYLESRMGSTITFKEFLRVGALVTLVNVVVYCTFLALAFYLL